MEKMKVCICPVCGSSLDGCYVSTPVHYEDGFTGLSCMFYDWKCDECKAIGEEHYVLEFMDQYNILKYDAEHDNYIGIEDEIESPEEFVEDGK